MLAWVMNMGFAASPAAAPAASGFIPEQYLGLTLMKLGGMIFQITLVMVYLGGSKNGT